ncbi:SprT family zinc-dependent metalloprotease [Algisphaera agarilytica]|uniref:Putative SprT family Zn-dependent metalloprotease n=1 Tax=Algisphaera agarilytica TaxID=1385975 RepID=A0A7X0LKG1_9BACT|nr:SprT-like domain-containing protein [Algisphaera agarilytica]MBB6429616.1 putative SprT family Zn-dependent metalloprotease [Algisphaera agarilytica]
MDLPSAGQLAQSLMHTHGLVAEGWTFRFNQRKRALGLCNYTTKRIELSAPFVARNDEHEVRDVILHEIAHALTPPPTPSKPRAKQSEAPDHHPNTYTPHGPAWRATCLRIGANPNRLNATAAAPEGKYQATCPGCQTTHHRHRKPAKGRTYICKACGPEHGKLTFHAA